MRLRSTLIYSGLALCFTTTVSAQLPPPPSLPQMPTAPGKSPPSLAPPQTGLQYSQADIEENLAEVAARLQDVTDRRAKAEARRDTQLQGCFSGNCQSGTGERLNEDGNYYNGEHRLHNPHGYGSFIWINGAQYTGDFEGGKKHGQGTYYAEDGSLYIGNFIQNARSGHGTDYYPSGDKYIGNHENGEAHGHGTYYSADGWVYIGDHKDGVSHGSGTYYFPDGRKYIGEFVNGTFNGRGVSYYADGKVHYSGKWRNNRPAQ